MQVHKFIDSIAIEDDCSSEEENCYSKASIELYKPIVKDRDLQDINSNLIIYFHTNYLLI